MNYEATGKVNAIKTDVADTELDDELNDYDDENLDFDSIKEDTEEDTEEKNIDSSTSSNENNNKKNDDLKKKLIKYMIIIGGGMLILLLLLALVSKLMTKSYTYQDVEEIMKNAAIRYFEENNKNLPQDETQTVEIDVANLVASERMKSLDEYLGEGHGCTGKVQVKLSGSTYVYTPYLTCGEKYSTRFLAEEITKDENLVGSGYGLYLTNDTYIFKGENVNNYIQLESKLWRIIKVNSDKTIELILNKPYDYEFPYDDRYNTEADDESGINSFQNSRIREQLLKMYNQTSAEEDDYILSEKDKTHLVSYDLCIGKMSLTDTIHDNSRECMQTISDKIGLLTISDYMNASSDANCNVVGSESCQNYNYLTINGSFWLMTPSTRNTYSAFSVTGGSIKDRTASENKKVRPVITLASNTLISGGNGTEANPYIVK